MSTDHIGIIHGNTVFLQLFSFPPLYIQAQANNSMSSTTQQEYVTLVSGDGFEFVVPRSTACVSGTIRRMLDSSSTLLTPLFVYFPRLLCDIY